ncbi:Zinc finger and btb domain-containing protein 17 [Camponotus japonicus]
MADNITTIHGDKSDDSSYTASPQSPPLLTDFEIQCKQEPCSNLHNSTDENPLAFDGSSSFSIPISVPMIKNPIVVLERCDKIWKTLQLIKVIQTDKPINDDTEENKEEEIQCSEKSIEKQPESRIMNQPTLRSHNTVPFKFSVQKTRKLYPCTICGKQYMERRSLRKHSDRVHGITLPLLIKRKRVKNTSQLSKKDIDKVNPVTLLNKESNDFENLNNDKNPHAKTKVVDTKTTALRKFVKCTLCQQKVTSIRKHLIHYHKIGGSSSMVEQLESSLLIENAASKDEKITSENVSSKKSPQPKTNTQDGFRIMDNEADTHRTSQVRKKRKYTLSYNTARKRFKLNNERYVINRHGPAVTQKQVSLNRTNQTSYQCDICLGVYASPRSLYKHRRNHIFRGETKENIHNVKCRYHNSPFNKKYKLLQSSIMSTVRNTSNSMNNVQLNNETLFKQNDKISKINRAIRYNGEIDKNNETICLCGRSFRNPHTLFTHKKICELYKQEDILSQHTSVSSDSGIGINITIKKLNDSYKIVGKDNTDDKLQESEIHFKENNLSISNTSDHTTKESVNLCINKQKESDNSKSNYSKDHSFLKLQVADEDVIIDIEDDVQMKFDKNNTSKQIVTWQDDKRSNGQNDLKNLKNDKQVSGKICTLRQMCKNVLDIFTHKSENAVENESQKNSQIEDQEENQKIYQENKRKLRSSNKRRRNEEEVEKEFDDDDLNGGIQNYMTNPLSVCGYCNEHFETINSYNNHQCTVKEGRPFDEFSLELLCFYCEDVLNSFNEYDKHMRVKHFDKAYHCYLCIERFANDKARLQHINLEHNNMPCRFCNEKLSIKVKALHEGYHLGFGHPCHKCKKAYTNGKNLSYHNYKSRLHPKTDNLVTCSICLKSIKIRSFRTHMATHKLNACYFCGKVFSNRTGIEFHTMIHHGTQSKLKCNVCGTRFFTKKQLEKHAKVDGCNSGVQEVKTRNFTATHH